MIITALAIVLIFAPFVPASGPCPWRTYCAAMHVQHGQTWGSPSYVPLGTGAFAAYPLTDLRNMSGKYVQAVNYFELVYDLPSCNEGEALALVQGGPWGCNVAVGGI